MIDLLYSSETKDVSEMLKTKIKNLPTSRLQSLYSSLISYDGGKSLYNFRSLTSDMINVMRCRLNDYFNYPTSQAFESSAIDCLSSSDNAYNPTDVSSIPLLFYLEYVLLVSV